MTAVVEVLARSLSVAVDVAAWSLDRYAQAAEPLGRRLTDSADAARYFAHLTRCVP